MRTCNDPRMPCAVIEQSLEIKRRLGMKGGIAASLHSIANIENATGKPEEALKNFTESLNIRREIGDKAGIGDVLIDLGVFYGDHNQPDQALKLFKESLQIQIDLGNEQNRALLLNNIGNIYLNKGNYQDARTYYEQALQIRQKFSVPADIAETLHNLGEASTDLGLYEKALDQYHQALDLQRKLGNKQMIAIENSSLGTVFGFQGRFGAALSAKEDAYKTFRDLGERSVWAVIIQGGYGEALAQVGQNAEAKKMLEEAIGLARELKTQDEIARILGIPGRQCFFRRRFEDCPTIIRTGPFRFSEEFRCSHCSRFEIQSGKDGCCGGPRTGRDSKIDCAGGRRGQSWVQISFVAIFFVARRSANSIKEFLEGGGPFANRFGPDRQARLALS